MLSTSAARVLGLLIVAQAAPLSVSELLANAERWSGQPVTISGVISNFRVIRWRKWGPLYTFDLSDGTEAVLVTAFAEPPCQSGTAKVEGTFEAVKRGVKDSLKEIIAHNVICLPDTMDPRGPKGK
jgi:hypothetical protein